MCKNEQKLQPEPCYKKELRKWSYTHKLTGPSPAFSSRGGQKPSEISDFTPCAHAQINILHIKYAQKTDNYGLGFGA